MTAPMRSAYRRAFISHAHADNELCARYAAALRARGIDCWLDLNDAQKGYALSEDIEKQLERRGAFILMVSAASNSSNWVGLELNNYTALWADQATHLLDGQERLILPVRLESTPVPTRVRGFNWIDAVGHPFEQVVDQIVRALAAPIVGKTQLAPPPVVPPPSLLLPGEPAPTLANLAELGIAGWRINGVEIIIPPLRDVSAGNFLMGSDPRQDENAADDEQPQYVIPLPYAYQIALFPVTVAEYACFVRDGHAAPDPVLNELAWDQQLQHIDHPIVNISWHDATAYTTWLAKTTSHPWRMLTEAEWEKAARWDPLARHSRIYPWGNTFHQDRCNTRGGRIRGSTPVGSYPRGASPCGAQDMAGNVWEWTSSLYKRYPYNARDGREWADSTDNRVLRGGSWYGNARNARAAYRGLGPAYALGDGGFRVVLAVAAAPGS